MINIKINQSLIFSKLNIIKFKKKNDFLFSNKDIITIKIGQKLHIPKAMIKPMKIPNLFSYLK